MVSLKKGGVVNLTKENAGVNLGKPNVSLSKVGVGLGWDINTRGGAQFDLDAWVMYDDGTKLTKKNLVYFAKTRDASGCIHHLGDNLTGVGDGDDETIKIDLSNVPYNYTKMLVGVTIYAGARRNQTFGMVDNTFIRIYNDETGQEICRYADRFTGELGNARTMLFGVLMRVENNPNEWEFRALGEGSKISSITDVVSVGADYLQYINNNTAVVNTAEKGRNFMAVSLSKGGKVSLAKVAQDAGIASLTNIMVGLGWNPNIYDGGSAFDLDASVFVCDANNKTRTENDFVFYNNLKSVDGSIQHMGDNRTGEGDGDDEVINIDLTKVDPSVEKINFTVTIDQADVRNQNFGQVSDAYIRVVDQTSGTELIRYDLGEDFSIETAVVVAQLYRHNGEWKFNAIGSGFAGGLAALCNNFGIQVG